MSQRENAGDKRKDSKKHSRKKKYSTPKLTVSGNLLSVPDSIWVNAILLCCLTQRLEVARRSPAERNKLLADVTRMAAA
jgi:hypothetical protein